MSAPIPIPPPSPTSGSAKLWGAQVDLSHHRHRHRNDDSDPCTESMEVDESPPPPPERLSIFHRRQKSDVTGKVQRSMTVSIPRAISDSVLPRQGVRSIGSQTPKTDGGFPFPDGSKPEQDTDEVDCSAAKFLESKLDKNADISIVTVFETQFDDVFVDEEDDVVVETDENHKPGFFESIVNFPIVKEILRRRSTSDLFLMNTIPTVNPLLDTTDEEYEADTGPLYCSSYDEYKSLGRTLRSIADQWADLPPSPKPSAVSNRRRFSWSY